MHNSSSADFNLEQPEMQHSAEDIQAIDHEEFKTGTNKVEKEAKLRNKRINRKLNA